VFLEQEQRNQDAPDASIPVEKRVDDFELGVHDGQLNQRIGSVRVVVLLPVVEVFQEDHWIGGHEVRLLNGAARASNPVLHAAKMAAPLVAPANAVEKLGMKIQEQVQVEGPTAQRLLGAAEGSTVVDDLLNVEAPRLLLGLVPGLKSQNLVQRGLRSLDARRKHRLLRGHGRQQDRGVGNAEQDSVVA